MGLILDALGGCAATLNEYQKESLCLQKIKAIINNIQIPANLRAFGIPESALPLLAADAIRQERLLSRCPRKLTEEDILHIYRAAY